MLLEEVNMMKRCMIRAGSERMLVDVRAHAAPRAFCALCLRVVLRHTQAQPHLQFVMDKHHIFHLRRCNLQLPKKIKCAKRDYSRRVRRRRRRRGQIFKSKPGDSEKREWF